jgi:hypothetical protein
VVGRIWAGKYGGIVFNKLLWEISANGKSSLPLQMRQNRYTGHYMHGLTFIPTYNQPLNQKISPKALKNPRHPRHPRSKK